MGANQMKKKKGITSVVPNIIKKVSRVTWNSKAAAPLAIECSVLMQLDDYTQFEVQHTLQLGANVIQDLISNIPGELTIVRDKDNNVVWAPKR